jgi:hypothetical protein
MPCALGTLRVGWHRELCVQVRHGFDLVLPLLSGGGGSSSVSALSVLVSLHQPGFGLLHFLERRVCPRLTWGSL